MVSSALMGFQTESYSVFFGQVTNISNQETTLVLSSVVRGSAYETVQCESNENELSYI
jgi:hypothetical protein